MMSEAYPEQSHCPVLLYEALEWLNANKGGQFLDCTFGGGGHTTALLEANENNFVFSLDCDPAAKARAQDILLKHKNFRFYQINFSEAECLLLPKLDGILMDLGVSSFQLDDEARGFSFKNHTLLDMRLDNSRGITAEEFLRTARESDLVTAIRDYGEEELWKKVVRMIVENRNSQDLRYADTFAKLIANCVSKKFGQRIHPATKVFQGIRIFINDELGSLERALPDMFSKLAIGGRLVVISFHSLEDRIVKKFFNQMAGKAVDRFDDTYQQDRVSYGNLLTKKPIVPSEGEIASNPRSRSAKLRVLEKTSMTDSER